MEEKVIFVEKDHLSSLNEELKHGWRVKMMTPIAQPGYLGQYGCNRDGVWGTYVVLEKAI